MSRLKFIFDLDGTLIDSAETIISALRIAIIQHHVKPLVNIDESLIGPSLRQIIIKLLGPNEISKTELVESSFKFHYDETEFKRARPYMGVSDLLGLMQKNAYELFIATNKRQNPTNKIINFLKWNDYFKNVYGLEGPLPAKNKTELIRSILMVENLNPEDVYYIGDRVEDYEAASENKIRFVHAEWGYGTIKNVEAIKNPLELWTIIDSN